MKSVIERIKKYRFNKHLIKNVYKKKRMGVWDKQSLKVITISANVVLLTFIIRFFSRVYMMYEMEGTDLATFFHRKYLILVVWLIVYAVFANYLLGIGNTDRNIKIYSIRYVKTLVFLVLYLIEIFISLFFFINGIYDYKILAIICLLSLIPTLISYFCIFMTTLDFIMYTTDNSDDIESAKGEHFDYF